MACSTIAIRSYDDSIFHVLRADFLIRCGVAPASLTFFHLHMGLQWAPVQLFAPEVIPHKSLKFGRGIFC